MTTYHVYKCRSQLFVEQKEQKRVYDCMNKRHMKRHLENTQHTIIHDPASCVFTSWATELLASFQSKLILARVTMKRGPQNMRYARVIITNIFTRLIPSSSSCSIWLSTFTPFEGETTSRSWTKISFTKWCREQR